jgi:superfamily II DNA or RNA helicase
MLTGVTPPGNAQIRKLAFPQPWRRYQTLALQAFEQDKRHASQRTYIVAPPGSGKTLIGIDIVRRLGTRALVLVPNSAVQAQWLHAVREFGAPSGLAAADPAAPIACLTYQALCQLDDPAAALGNLAERRWATERARATGTDVLQVEQEALSWTGEAAARRRRELARITASVKREIARAEHDGLRLGELLSQGARDRLETLRAGRVQTVVLDECHHLASMWGYLIRAALDELGDVHVIGLTATPPDALTAQESDLYFALLGEVDFTVPTPALVRERSLAPYQELAWLTRPLDSETAWLAEHDVRFQELITDLHAEGGDVMSLPAWVIGRMRDRARNATDDAAVSWNTFQRRHPALARAGARFLASGGLELPPGVPRGEGYREPPALDDWLVLLEDYALHCLAADPSGAAASRYQGVASALRSLGFLLTRQGIRRGASDVDRLLTTSAAKPVALVDVVGCEYDARGDRLRALILTDAEVASAPSKALSAVIRPEAGSAPEAVRALAADSRTAPLRPLLVSGRGLRCAAPDAPALLAALQAQAGQQPSGWRAEPDEFGLVRLMATGTAWQSRLWVELATRIFTLGSTRILVGTRALLGEGWDAPCVNCLVDLSAATTGVSVLQSRGRSLRLDAADPEKIASNWDIVCVAPELARGTADYERFVRKHLHLFAPSEDGAIEAGPSHVHPALGPFAPPPDSSYDEINRAMVRRAADHQLARRRWGIGQPYTGAEQETLVIRGRRPGQPGQPPPEVSDSPPSYQVSQRGPARLAAAAAAAAVLVTAASRSLLALTVLAAVPAALGWAGLRLARTQRALADALPLDLAGQAICDAYRSLGELTDDAARSLAIEPRASGYLRCFLRTATTQESERFARALGDVLAPAEFPRYLVSRLVPAARHGALAPVLRWLRRRAPFEHRWVAVPADLGRGKHRAEAFAKAWRRWLGPAELQFTQRGAAGQDAVAGAGAQADDYETSIRRIWV